MGSLFVMLSIARPLAFYARLGLDRLKRMQPWLRDLRGLARTKSVASVR